MRGVRLAFLCCLSREVKICLMGRSAEFILANKEELTTFFFIHAIVLGNQRRCAGQHDTFFQLGSLQNSFPWIFTDGRQGCQGSIRGS